MLIMAANTKGFVIYLVTAIAPERVPVNEQIAKGFEKGFYLPGQIEKRAGRFITFRGLPTYQTEGNLADGRTCAVRIFTAHGLVYHLSLIGAIEPIEDNPGFETFMQGFDFTTPPEPDLKRNDSGATQAPPKSAGQSPPAMDSDFEQTLRISFWMGRMVRVCIIGIIVLLLFRWAFRKRKTKI